MRGAFLKLKSKTERKALVDIITRDIFETFLYIKYGIAVFLMLTAFLEIVQVISHRGSVDRQCDHEYDRWYWRLCDLESRCFANGV